MSDHARYLEYFLDRICMCAQRRERVSFGLIMRATGSRSFGPMLLLIGLILASPLSGIPGMATSMAILLLLLALQMLWRTSTFWLPDIILRRSIQARKLQRAVEYLRRPARWIDMLMRPRWQLLASGPGRYAIALACLSIALILPLMELIPFSASTAGCVLSIFGLALVTRDGLVALLAFVLTTGTLYWVLSEFL